MPRPRGYVYRPRPGTRSCWRPRLASARPWPVHIARMPPAGVWLSIIFEESQKFIYALLHITMSVVTAAACAIVRRCVCRRRADPFSLSTFLSFERWTVPLLFFLRPACSRSWQWPRACACESAFLFPWSLHFLWIHSGLSSLWADKNVSQWGKWITIVYCFDISKPINVSWILSRDKGHRAFLPAANCLISARS